MSPHDEAAPRRLRLTEDYMLGRRGDVIEIARIGQEWAGYRYVASGRMGVSPLRELLDAAEEVER